MTAITILGLATLSVGLGCFAVFMTRMMLLFTTHPPRTLDRLCVIGACVGIVAGLCLVWA